MIINLLNFGGQMPMRAHNNDAGADVFATKDYRICPNTTIKMLLGFGLILPDGYAGYIFPRSGLASQGIVCEIPPIDSGYRGEIHAIISNIGIKEYDIKKGDRVGQLVIMPVVIPIFTYDFGVSRGSDGFGSTGR